MYKTRKYGRIRPYIRNNKADLQWLRKATRKKRPREWRGAAKEEKV